MVYYYMTSLKPQMIPHTRNFFQKQSLKPTKMVVQRMPARLSDLPTFTYTKAIDQALVRHQGNGKPKPTFSRHKAVSKYKGKIILTRRTYHNLIDPASWAKAKRPSDWPAHLHFPEDILKFALFSTKAPRGRRATRRRTANFALNRMDCETCNSNSNSADTLCTCTAAPWEATNTLDWQDQNIALRWVSDEVGIGTYALNPFSKDTTLGEYLGELVPTRETSQTGSDDDRYLYDATAVDGDVVALIDGLRVGNWVRYINHSCTPNTMFERLRVGEELRNAITATRKIAIGDEVTVDYGRQYWNALNKKGVWCNCGAAKCKYSRDGTSEQEIPARTEG